MSWLIMNDLIDYPCEWYPTHIMTSDRDIIPVFLGASSEITDKRAIGIYVRDEDYIKINHRKAYLFIHNPDAVKEDIKLIEWDMLPDVSEEKSISTGREHIHMWVDKVEMEEVN